MAHPAGPTSRWQCLCSLKSDVTRFPLKVRGQEARICRSPPHLSDLLTSSWLSSARGCSSVSFHGQGHLPVPGAPWPTGCLAKQTHPPPTESQAPNLEEWLAELLKTTTEGRGKNIYLKKQALATKGICMEATGGGGHQACRPEFSPWNHNGGRRKGSRGS